VCCECSSGCTESPPRASTGKAGKSPRASIHCCVHQAAPCSGQRVASALTVLTEEGRRKEGEKRDAEVAACQSREVEQLHTPTSTPKEASNGNREAKESALAGQGNTGRATGMLALATHGVGDGRREEDGDEAVPLDTGKDDLLGAVHKARRWGGCGSGGPGVLASGAASDLLELLQCLARLQPTSTAAPSRRPQTVTRHGTANDVDTCSDVDTGKPLWPPSPSLQRARRNTAAARPGLCRRPTGRLAARPLR